MPNEKKTLFEIFISPDFWVFAVFFVAGTVTLAIRKSDKPFSIYTIIGETVIAMGVAFICWLAGLYHDMDQVQLALIALPSAYGQIHIVKQLVRALRANNEESQRKGR